MQKVEATCADPHAQLVVGQNLKPGCLRPGPKQG